MHKRLSQENLKGVDICRKSEAIESVDLILVCVKMCRKSKFLKIGSRNGLFGNMVVIIRGHLKAANF